MLKRTWTRGPSRWVLSVPLLALLWGLSASALAQEWDYRVRPGDTIWDLAGAYLKPDVPWQRLQEHNRITDPYRLPPGSTLRIPVAWLQRQPARARVLAVNGDAVAQAGGRDAPVTAGMSLGSGAMVKTAADASLSLQFADGSRLTLLGGSELLLDRLTRFGRSGMADTRLRLQRGRIVNDVRPLRGSPANFIVDTPSASSAVRGTQFRVAAADARTQTEVLEGRVAVSTPRGSALLRPGFGALVAAGQAGVKPIALLPAPDLSGNPGYSLSARPELAWPAVAGAARYRVQASGGARFDTLSVDAETGSPAYTLPALGQGVHFVRVRAIDAAGVEGRDAILRLQVDGQPQPPYTIAPAAESVVRTPEVVLSWTQAPTAVGYEYEVAQAAGAAPAVQARTGGRTQATLDTPLAPGDYTWRVRSIDASGKAGPFGDAVPFVVRPLVPVTDIDSAAATAGDTREVTFRWPAGQPGQRYRFQMSRSPDFGDIRVDEVVDRAEITLPKLRSGTWYLRAQTIDSDGFEGPFPPAQKIEVPCRLCRIGIGAGALLILLAL